MVDLTNLEKHWIQEGKFTQEMIETTLNDPDLTGSGMNPTDKGYAKQFGEKIMIIIENKEGKRISTDIFSNLGDISQYADISISDLIMTAHGAQPGGFYASKNAFGKVE